MYAVIRTGGKQYRVAEGEQLSVEKLEGEAGSTVEFDEVLMVGEGQSVTIGKPVVDGGKVSARIVEHTKDPKVEIVKFKRRTNYHRSKGHRQPKTLIEITGISGG